MVSAFAAGRAESIEPRTSETTPSEAMPADLRLVGEVESFLLNINFPTVLPGTFQINNSSLLNSEEDLINTETTNVGNFDNCPSNLTEN